MQLYNYFRSSASFRVRIALQLKGLPYDTYYRPSWTESWRPGVTTKLKWDFNEAHSIDVGYWYERARQRQTQPFISITENGTPDDIWGDYNSGNQLKDNNGATVQGRHQYTVTPAQKIWAQDVWTVTPDLTLTGGSDLTQVWFPTWSEKNGQDDLQWYEAKKQADKLSAEAEKQIEKLTAKQE